MNRLFYDHYLKSIERVYCEKKSLNNELKTAI